MNVAALKHQTTPYITQNAENVSEIRPGNDKYALQNVLKPK